MALRSVNFTTDGNTRSSTQITSFCYSDAEIRAGSFLMYASLIMHDSTAKEFFKQIKNHSCVTLTLASYYRCDCRPTTHNFMSHRAKGQTHIIIKAKNYFLHNGHIHATFYANDDEDYEDMLKENVYQAIVNHTSIPVIPEWKDYLYENIREKNNVISETLNVDDENNELIHYGFTRCGYIKFVEIDVLNMIQKGLAKKAISIDGCNEASAKIIEVEGLQNYLAEYGQILANKVVETFTPEFDSTTKAVDTSVNDIYSIAQYYNEDIKSYAMQKNVVQGITNHLKHNKFAMISAEPGAGKSIMAIASVMNAAKKKQPCVIVMCPTPALCLHWKDEISRVVPMSEVIVIEHLHDIIALQDKIHDKKRTRSLWVIASTGILKSDYERRPSLLWSKRKNNYVCPHCGKVPSLPHVRNRFGRELIGHARNYFDDFDVLTAVNSNMVCEASEPHKGCGAPLTTVATKANSSQWIKFPKIGWLYKPRLNIIKEHAEEYIKGALPTMTQKQRVKYQAIAKAINDYQMCGAVERFPNRYSIARYIRKHLKGAFDYAICDEVHELAGDSLQGHAFGNIVCSAKKIIALTGTLSNGYAGGLFYLLFRVDTRRMIEHGFNYTSISAFEEQYGVKQYKEIREGYFDTSGEHDAYHFRTRRTIDKKNKTLAGISPLLPTDFLLDNTIFLQQKHIRQDLCDYTEYPVGVDLDPELQTAYNNLVAYQRESFAGWNTSNNNLSVKDKKRMRNNLMKIAMFCDQPYGVDVASGTKSDGSTIYLELDVNTVRNKEKKLLEILKEKKAAGEKALVFVEWTGRLEIQSRLCHFLEVNGIHTTEMDTRLRQSMREKWLNKKADEGYDAVVLNPRLIDKGLNLLAYTTIVFYEISTKLFTIRQASQRSRRINQDHAVSVYFLYYKNTIQQNLLALASQKLKASATIEGTFTQNGLSQFTDDTDLMAAIASAFANNEDIVVNNENFEHERDDSDAIKDDGSQSSLVQVHFEPLHMQYEEATSKPVYNLYAIA